MPEVCGRQETPNDTSKQKLFKIVLTPLGCFERLPPHTEQIKHKMRTKTLLLTAALSAAGVASTMAQVYSVNAVGYVNVKVKGSGFQMIANPLKAADNKISALLPSVPDGTTVYKYNGSTYDGATFLFGAWDNPNMTLEPGEGAFIQNPDAAELTLTFVGEVSTGALSNPIPSGFSIRSSQVPQTGKLQADLGFPAVDGDVVYKYDEAKQNYDSYSVLFGSWTPEDPTVEVGESVFVQKSEAVNWTRNFSVN